jgi:gas vesicle protein
MLTTVILFDASHHYSLECRSLILNHYNPKTFFMTNTWKVVIAVGAGAAVGITLGLLFAPEKGSEIRKRIAEQGRKIVDELKDKIEEKKKEKFEARKNEWIEKAKEFA